MKTDPPNAAEKRWREMVREQGCILGYPGPVEIHHVVGRTAKHQKIEIGHWWILPVSPLAHAMVGGSRKQEQKDLFMEVCGNHVQMYGDLPVPAAALWAIWDWHR